MRRISLYLVMIICGVLSLLRAVEAQAAGSWLEVEMGVIGTASTEILSAAMDETKAGGYDGLVIVLDTPGGLLDATHTMVKMLLDTDIPVIVWVAPAGAHAASAGSFITLAAPIAAMAPGTNIGAAHPVFIGQGKDEETNRKVLNDTTALMESIASLRGRNEEIAISFVVGSLSLTAQDALAKNVINVVAGTYPELFEKLSGRTVALRNHSYTFGKSEPRIVTFQKSPRHLLLEILSNPNLFYILLLAGLIGLGIELTHPGAIFPGVAGGIALILALLATSVLPVNFAALLLILASLAFIVAEAFVPSFGVLGIGGIVAFVLGSALLIDPHNAMGLKLSWLTIVPAALVFAGFAGGISWLVLRAERRRVETGAEGMIGAIGVVIRPFHRGKGRVRIMGENWLARTEDGVDLHPPAEVEVRRLDGLELIVTRRAPPAP